MRLASFVGSDALIVAAIFMHVSEATIFLSTRAADGTIGMSALLHTFGTPTHAAIIMYGAAILAMVGLLSEQLTRNARLLMLLPQFSLLQVTGLAAMYAVIHQSYADDVLRGWQFIACDQFARMGAAPLYLIAALARAKREV